jgi:hypothetical protein
MPFHNSSSSSSNSSSDDNCNRSIIIPECGIVSTNSEKIALIQTCYTMARNEIIQGLIPLLLRNDIDDDAAPQQSWICSKILFNSQTLPPSISVSKFGMEVWKLTGDDAIICQGGTEVYLGRNQNEGAVLLRHKFDNGYYYYRACALPDLHRQSESELEAMVSRLVQEFYQQDECESFDSLTDAMASLVPRALANVMAAKELRVGIVPRTYTISWKEQLVTYIQC